MWEKSSLFCRGYNQKNFFDYLIFKSDLQWKTDLINVNCPRNLGMLPGNIDNIWINVSVNLGNMPVILGTLYIFLGQFVVLLPDMLKKNEQWKIFLISKVGGVGQWVGGWVGKFQIKAYRAFKYCISAFGGSGVWAKILTQLMLGMGGGSLIKCW